MNYERYTFTQFHCYLSEASRKLSKQNIQELFYLITTNSNFIMLSSIHSVTRSLLHCACHHHGALWRSTVGPVSDMEHSQPRLHSLLSSDCSHGCSSPLPSALPSSGGLPLPPEQIKSSALVTPQYSQIDWCWLHSLDIISWACSHSSLHQETLHIWSVCSNIRASLSGSLSLACLCQHQKWSQELWNTLWLLDTEDHLSQHHLRLCCEVQWWTRSSSQRQHFWCEIQFRSDRLPLPFLGWSRD